MHFFFFFIWVRCTQKYLNDIEKKKCLPSRIKPLLVGSLFTGCTRMLAFYHMFIEVMKCKFPAALFNMVFSNSIISLNLTEPLFDCTPLSPSVSITNAAGECL